MKLRDNAELRSAVRREVNMISDHETPPLVDRILDAVDRALAAPSPETGTAAVPTCRLCDWAFTSSPCDKCPDPAAWHARRAAAFVPGPAPEPVKPPATDDEYPPVHLVQLRICQACLDGLGSECHTPGCALWLHSVDLPIHRELYEVVEPAPAPLVATAEPVKPPSPGTGAPMEWPSCPTCGGPDFRVIPATHRRDCTACGEGVAFDEDGCCSQCGADTVLIDIATGKSDPAVPRRCDC